MMSEKILDERRFVYEKIFFIRVLRLSKTNAKQRRSPTFCVGSSAKTDLV